MSRRKNKKVEEMRVIPATPLSGNNIVVFYTDKNSEKLFSMSASNKEMLRFDALFQRRYHPDIDFISEILKVVGTGKIKSEIRNAGTHHVSSTVEFNGQEMKTNPSFSSIVSKLTGGDIVIDEDLIYTPNGNDVAFAKFFKRYDVSNVIETIKRPIVRKCENGKFEYHDAVFKSMGPVMAAIQINTGFGPGLLIPSQIAESMTFYDKSTKEDYTIFGNLSDYLKGKIILQHLSTKEYEDDIIHTAQEIGVSARKMKGYIKQFKKDSDKHAEPDLTFIEHIIRESGYKIEEVCLDLSYQSIMDSSLAEIGKVQLAPSVKNKRIYSVKSGSIVLSGDKGKKKIDSESSYFLSNLMINTENVKIGVLGNVCELCDHKCDSYKGKKDKTDQSPPLYV